MQPTLSALVPVRNIQATLETDVHRLLDVLPELTDRFQMVIVDDCSSDATAEIAPELASCYPQIKVVHHTRPMGRVAALHTGLAHSSGSVLFYQDENCTLAIDEVPKLWRAVGVHEVVIGRAAQGPTSKWNRFQGAAPRQSGNYQFVHRALLEQLEMSLVDDATLRDVLMELDFRWLEVDVRDRSFRPLPKASTSPRHHRSESSWADLADENSSRPKAPNYLKRLRDFAFGE